MDFVHQDAILHRAVNRANNVQRVATLGGRRLLKFLEMYTIKLLFLYTGHGIVCSSPIGTIEKQTNGDVEIVPWFDGCLYIPWGSP